MTKATQTEAWGQLQAHYEKTKDVSLAALFEQDPARAQKWGFSLGGLTADFSHTHLTGEMLDLFLDFAKEQELKAWREKMFTGAKINNTEDRAVLHVALRGGTEAPVLVDGKDIVPEISATHAKMESFVMQVRDGTWCGATGQPIRAIVNIGIGGSDLGPRLVVSALSSRAKGPKVHFVANVDAFALNDVLEGLDPATTLFVVVSKTFTTQETLLNASSARQWLIDALGEDAVAQHFVAVSTNQVAVEAFGMAPDNVFAMWDWVGGRYSLWSAVGLSIALSIGWEGFKKLLSGAAQMDRHFATAPLARNIPFLMGALGVWYRNFGQAPALAVLPYAERLRDLPRFLQQLDMESNGKSVTRDGEALDYETAPIIFGECGSVSQHSFHQWLHQGTGLVLSDFIGVREDDQNRPDHHAILHAHMKAQIDALAFGEKQTDPAKANAGNKPSESLTLERLDPENLGLLLALYEHKIFVQGVLWEIDSFDQFGVELGKKLAKDSLKV